MQHAQRLTLEELEEFVSSSSSLSFSGADRKEIYGLVEGALRARRYTGEDIALLAAADAAHEGLSGPALRHVLEREYRVYGNQQYQRLASISASHIYNLQRTAAYRRHHLQHGKTRPRAVAIGERRRPDPRGRPGYLRVDTVHQGDSATRKGLYHLNAVDTVTQWLLLGEFTQSRPQRTTDNALVEGNNGAVVRKHIGHEPIAAEHQRFYTACCNPYLNYHRPCRFATEEVLGNGRRRRRYRLQDYRTPYEKLLCLDDWEQHLKAGISAALLEQQALRMNNTACAPNMQQAKRKLLAQCRSRW